MKQIKFFIISLLLIAVLNSCQKPSTPIEFSNQAIVYEGRMDTTDGVSLYWSGSSIKLKFKGTNLSALLKDQGGDNYFNVIIDEDSIVLLHPNTEKQYYSLAENLPYGEHSIELFKRSEWDRGKTTFYGYKIAGAYELIGIEKPQRKIEFYGNSITAGYAVEDTTGGDSPDSTYTNNYKSYAYLTAQHFNAQYHCTCKSGIGIMVSWFPIIMPEIYMRINPEDSTSIWDFENYQPNLLVLNLFQNDSWIVLRPEMPEFKKYLGHEPPNEAFIINAYKNFVSSLRIHYPNTTIICMLGNMDITRDGSPWPAYVKQAIVELNDDKIFTHFVPYKNTSGHPDKAEQEYLAKSLIQFIDSLSVW